MPIVTIPFGNGTYRNVYDTELNDKNVITDNGYVDEAGYLRGRPGLEIFQDITSTLGISSYPINSLWYWPHKDCLLCVAYGSVLKINYESGYITVTKLTGSDLLLNSTASITSSGDYAFICNGGKLNYTDGATTVSPISDTDCPTVVTHVAWMDGYLLACGDNSNKFYWSDVNTPLSWNALSFASGASNADYINALHCFNQEIYLFGRSSLEVWSNDGVTPFSRVTGGAYNVGCLAPHSIVFGDQDIYWLSDKGRIVKFSQGRIDIVSTPYDREISSFATVSDCRAYSATIAGNHFLVFVFPSAQRTLVYSVSHDKWHEWSYWNKQTGQRENWIGANFLWIPSWNLYLVGDRRSGIIYQASSDIYDDAGDPMRVVQLTGHIDYGTREPKRSEQIWLRARRGETDIGREANLMLSINDDNRGFGREKTFSLGNIGERDIVIQVPRTGIFKTRQYRLSIADPVPVAIGEAQENITLLRR